MLSLILLNQTNFDENAPLCGAAAELREHSFSHLVSEAAAKFVCQEMAGLLTGINPLDFENLIRIVPTDKTRLTYQKQWTNFVSFSGISSQIPPTEEMFASFLEQKRKENLKGKTLQSWLSALSTMCLYFYNFKLDTVSDCKKLSQK